MAKKMGSTKSSAFKPKKISPASKPRSKSEILNVLSEQTELSRKQVAAVFDSLGRLLAADLGKGGPGMANVPGMMKVVVVRKPATKARPGINPFTKEEVMFKAKPARNIVKIRALKALKDMV
jgi:nucleoid DNA-binding protein